MKLSDFQQQRKNHRDAVARAVRGLIESNNNGEKLTPKELAAFAHGAHGPATLDQYSEATIYSLICAENRRPK